LDRLCPKILSYERSEAHVTAGWWPAMTTTRFAMYVDGYNFYYAVKKRLPKTWIHLGWCDFAKLARDEIIVGRGSLARIKYFTAPVEDFGELGGELGGERERQARWLEAVETIDHIEVIYGFHNGNRQLEPHRHRAKRDEKTTDVNIAINLVLDAAKNLYDRAILVTADYDQIPSVLAVTAEFPSRHVEVWLPPGHSAGRWSKLAGVSVHQIEPRMLRRSRLPERVHYRGRLIEAPLAWRA
jgi:uncharacterized LabA/DUF88 family protein